MRTFISFKEARETVLASAHALESESIRLSDALGRTLAEPVRSSEDIPPFANSAMDGFAVHADECQNPPVKLKITADIPAGTPFAGTVGPGECARIMTGALVPDSVDAVVPVERTREENGHVWIDAAPAARAHIRRAGRDVKKNADVFSPGVLITPPVVGMLATLGYDPVKVSVQPRVTVVSTGDEIVPAAATPGPGEIRNSNGPALAAQVVSAGGLVDHVLHAPDTPEGVREAVKAATGSHLIVFSGGVSMGDYDYVRTELDVMGADWDFWKVKQRPGKPLAFGQMGDTLLLGLPGNPVSSAMCFEVYARPLIATMLGRSEVFRPLERATLTRSIKKVTGLHFFTRGIVDSSSGKSTVQDTGPQGSNLYSSVVQANCIIHLPEGLEQAEAGMDVQIERLNW